MNKQEILDGYNKVNAQVKSETGREIPVILVAAGFTMRAFLKARRRARDGDYTAALYYLVLWASLKASAEHAERVHHLKTLKERYTVSHFKTTSVFN